MPLARPGPTGELVLVGPVTRCPGAQQNRRPPVPSGAGRRRGIFGRHGCMRRTGTHRLPAATTHPASTDPMRPNTGGDANSLIRRARGTARLARDRAGRGELHAGRTEMVIPRTNGSLCRSGIILMRIDAGYDGWDPYAMWPYWKGVPWTIDTQSRVRRQGASIAPG
jgi:hypothetical protein